METNHLSYYVIVYDGVISTKHEVDYLQYATFEEMLNYLDECKQEYCGCGYIASVSIIKAGEEIDREIIHF